MRVDFTFWTVFLKETRWSNAPSIIYFDGSLEVSNLLSAMSRGGRVNYILSCHIVKTFEPWIDYITKLMKTVFMSLTLLISIITPVKKSYYSIFNFRLTPPLVCHSEHIMSSVSLHDMGEAYQISHSSHSERSSYF